MNNLKTVKVDEVFGTPIYYNPVLEKFTAEYKGNSYRADRLSDIKRDLEVERPAELEEPVIYASGVGEMVLTTIIEISPHGWLTPRERAGYGVSPNPEHKHIYPKTDDNMAVYKIHKELRNKGWALINQADAMVSQLKPYPKNYWKEKAKQIRMEQSPPSSTPVRNGK